MSGHLANYVDDQIDAADDRGIVAATSSGTAGASCSPVVPHSGSVAVGDRPSTAAADGGEATPIASPPPFATPLIGASHGFRVSGAYFEGPSLVVLRRADAPPNEGHVLHPEQAIALAQSLLGAARAAIAARPGALMPD
ncbi:hypothetical protein [Sphingomonas oligoaromativorans]|uniref:hypothetical protein n=1 Tax=Sphingomonas oligoaromativorans TaxID=575322 RepID=UPI001420E5B7|nr:hypothetical protein [Sphingomonas oligoaromativorans]NIJ34323.1 hypothetical protein [Sphingomonas oligoaromativorans]